MDKISVIMPCYNAGAHLKRGVESALDQTYGDIELIVVNDGSTDSSLGILNGINDPRIKVITQTKSGVCRARNRGLREATGGYIAFLDADDTWDKTCLEKLLGALLSDPDAMISYCGWQNVGLPGGQGKPYLPPEYEGTDKARYLLGSCPWPIHAALTRKSAITEAGGFDERFSNAEDYGLWLKIALSNRIVRVPEVLAYYWFHGGAQASKNRARAACENWLVQTEFLKRHPEIRKKLGRSLERSLVHGELLKRGYICYWDRDLEAARKIFRAVMKTGYGTVMDWKYMLPSVLPMPVHRLLLRVFESGEGAVL